MCCLICGTDLKIYHSGNPRVKPPQILGHELAGKIVHIGQDAAGKYSLGERVTLATTVACGKCAYCRMGLGNMCPDAQPLGCGRDGGFAALMELPAEAVRGGNVIPAEGSCPDEVIAFSEPLSCAINAQDIIQVGEGDKVLVIGGGPLGAINAELAKVRGAQVLLSNRSRPRLEMLSGLKDIQLSASSGADLHDAVMEFTGGVGADKVIVCAPSAPAMEQALSLARKGGWISYFASLPRGMSDLTLDSRLIHYNELRVAGSSDSRPEHVAEAVRILESGEFNAVAILTHRIPLEQFMDGLRLMEEKTCLKVAVYPQGA